MYYDILIYDIVYDIIVCYFVYDISMIYSSFHYEMINDISTLFHDDISLNYT